MNSASDYVVNCIIQLHCQCGGTERESVEATVCSRMRAALTSLLSHCLLWLSICLSSRRCLTHQFQFALRLSFLLFDFRFFFYTLTLTHMLFFLGQSRQWQFGIGVRTVANENRDTQSAWQPGVCLHIHEICENLSSEEYERRRVYQ